MLDLHPLANYIAACFAQSKSPALAVAIVNKEKLLWTSRYGTLAPGVPLPDDALFPAGSITKSFVACAIMRAIEAGRLALDAPVTDYLPWFSVQNRFLPIQIRHLLMHTAGLFSIMDESPDQHSAVYALRQHDIPYPPGSRFHYSDAGYQTLALVLESVYGLSFPEVMDQQVFRPLGMNDSYGATTFAMRSRMPVGLAPVEDDVPAGPHNPFAPAPWFEVCSGDSSILVTLEDMTQFARMLLNEGQPLVSPETYAQMTSDKISCPFGEYGYGLILSAENGQDIVFHNGGMPGHVAQVRVDRRSGLGVVILAARPLPTGLFDTLLDRLVSLVQGEGASFTVPSSARIENPARYTGTYHHLKQSFTFVTDSGDLYLENGAMRLKLLPHPDGILIPDRAFAPCFLDFHFDERGAATGFYLGSDHFIRAGLVPPQVDPPPAGWRAYPGHYRSHIPWQSNFYILLRGADLIMLAPDGLTTPLHPLQGDRFAVADADSPDRLHFHDIVAGKALRVNYMGSDYYRFSTS